ncbi:MAG: C25 family cysteine peptidase [Gaiellaceae bacterium]
MIWVLAAPRAALAPLRALVREYERSREVRVVDPAPLEVLREAADGAAGLLLVGDRRRGPRTALPGPFLEDASGRLVPAGWLPDLGAELELFARAAARVQRRPGPVGPIAVLGQREPRYLQLAGRMEANLRGRDAPPFQLLRWTSERITRDDVVRGLRLGIGAGVYFGHGRPSGWAGYHGLRAFHLVEAAGEPLGALLSVTCLTASRHRVSLSFSEAVVAGGAAAAAVGAVARVAHLDSMRWMLGLAEALRSGELRLGPALLAAAPPDPRLQTPYRIVGDPLARLVGTAEGERRAARVFAPPAEFAA